VLVGCVDGVVIAERNSDVGVSEKVCKESRITSVFNSVPNLKTYVEVVVLFQIFLTSAPNGDQILMIRPLSPGEIKSPVRNGQQFRWKAEPLRTLWKNR
jgi:hypothetical protein